MHQNNFLKIKRIIEEGNIVALTGAGMSEESGIPTFRGNDGLWKKYDPALYANIPGLLSTYLVRPYRVNDFVVEIYETVLNASPNKGHRALARFEKEGKFNGVITQNIDNLHREAGNSNVIELHGNLFLFRCLKCRRIFQLESESVREKINILKKERRSRRALLRFFPRCKCGGLSRPDVVLFGESLREEILKRAYDEVNKCSTIIIIGTSGTVYPAADIPFYASRIGKKIIEVNPQTEFNNIADISFRENVNEFFGRLLSTLL